MTFPPIRNARIYWRPNRGTDDPGGFYPVCLEPECNGTLAWGDEEGGRKTGEEAARYLIAHRKSTHPKETESLGLLPREQQPRYLYNPADTDAGGLA